MTAGGAPGARRRVRGPGRARELAAAPAPRTTYQAWGLRAGGAAPVPLPTFSRDGAVLILNDVSKYAGVGVTVEPNGGSQQPSSAPFVVASL